MIKTFFSCLTILVLLASHGHAQQRVYSCETEKELIIKMKDTGLGSYTLWDAVLGLEGAHEHYQSAINIDEGSIAVIGTSHIIDNEQTDLLLAELDYRGRMTWKKNHQILGFKNAVKILSTTKDNYIVAVNAKGKNTDHIWVGRFDKRGDLIKSHIISDNKNHLSANDIIAKKTGYTLAVNVKNKADLTPSHSRLYTLNSTGKVISHKSYITGAENKINNIAKAPNGKIIVNGHAAGDDRRINGWIMVVDSKNNIIWQRQYPRGRQAKLSGARHYQHGSLSNHIVVTGHASPAGGGARAAWVMMVDGANGTIDWQRYYTDTQALRGHEVIAHNNGLISVLANADDAPKIGKDFYARMLTLDPRGTLIDSKRLSNSDGARGYQILTNSRNDRVVIGKSRVIYSNGDDPKTGTPLPNTQSDDGWAIAVPKAPDFNDPCVPSRPAP